jgi:hypothetical protein
MLYFSHDKLFVCMFKIVNLILVDEIINLRSNSSSVNGYNETSNVFYVIEPFKLPFLFMLAFSLILFLDGKFIHNGFLSNLRNILWLRIKQHLKLNISKRLFFNIEKYFIWLILCLSTF